MFETVSPGAERRESRRRSLTTLPVSLLVHGLAIAAVPVTSLWNVTFPAQSPAMVMMYSIADPPPPPPPPPPPAAPKMQKVMQPQQNQLPPSTVLHAPAVIPDIIPVVLHEEPLAETTFEGDQGSGVEGGIEGGVMGGVVGGVNDGEAGGELGGTIGGVVGGVDDGRVVVPRDAALRMAPLSQVFPMYPENARIRGWEDRLVVRYVIGTNGRVKEVVILEPAGRKVFDEATVNAIRHWRFRPMVKDGKAMEVQHELTVYYKLNG